MVIVGAMEAITVGFGRASTFYGPLKYLMSFRTPKLPLDLVLHTNEFLVFGDTHRASSQLSNAL